MRTILLFAVCSVFSFNVRGQSDVNNHINQLNNDSFTIKNVNYIDVNVSFDSNAEKLLKKGKKATKELIQEMDNEKFIAIHLILTKIWCPNKLSKIKTQYIYDIDDIDKGEIVMEVYTANKLVFVKNIENNTIIASKKSVEKIKEYWLKLTGVN